MSRHGMMAGVVAAAMGVVGAVGATAQSVKVNWREKAPFSDFRTYQILPGNANGPDAFWTQFVPKYLNSALRAKGMNPAVTGATPDLKIAYHFKTQDVVDAQTTADGFGWGAVRGAAGVDGADGVADRRRPPHGRCHAPSAC